MLQIQDAEKNALLLKLQQPVRKGPSAITENEPANATEKAGA